MPKEVRRGEAKAQKLTKAEKKERDAIAQFYTAMRTGNLKEAGWLLFGEPHAGRVGPVLGVVVGVALMSI